MQLEGDNTASDPWTLHLLRRAEAVRCLGLYCLLPESTALLPDQDSPMAAAMGAAQRVALLRTALACDPAEGVREAAAMALCDLALAM